MTDFREGVSTEGKREFVRTSDNIPVYYELLSGEAPGGAQPDWELLFDINQKLNILLNHMSGQSGFNMPEARDVNISGGGLRFFSAERFNPGDRLFLKTFLPTHAHIIKIKCEVVRSAPTGNDKYETAVKYVDMDETTRDKIIRYIFAKQRKLLRGEKTAEK